MIPEPRRVAIHLAGHAVAQTLVGRGRFVVESVSSHAEPELSWRGLPARGGALLDRETFLGLYEFGLAALAGIAAEDRYLTLGQTVEEPVVALSDLAAWQEQSYALLQDEAKVQLVSLNVMRKLQEWMGDEVIWPVVERLADALLAQGTLKGRVLRQILAPLEGYHGRRS